MMDNGQRTKQKARIVIDVGMTALMPLLMAYSLVGEAPHEWLGMAMLVLFSIHQMINIRWYKSLFRGRYTAFRMMLVLVNTLLLIDFAILMYSGIGLSKHLLSWLPSFGRASSFRSLHLSCSHWGILLMSFHLGLHLNRFLGKMDGRQTTKSVLGILAAILCIYGAYTFFSNRYMDFLLLTANVPFFDGSRPLLPHLLQSTSVMVLFVVIGRGAAKLTYLTIKRKGDIL